MNKEFKPPQTWEEAQKRDLNFVGIHYKSNTLYWCKIPMPQLVKIDRQRSTDGAAAQALVDEARRYCFFEKEVTL